uniref:Uncharacterized protein n=1 Tax=Panagrolaimus sp. ES5 TaxID=591445 RepID=A0AC34GT71_9BILA
MMKIRSIETTENDKIINIEIDKKAINSPFFYWPINNKYQNTIKEIQIRCVKAFKKGKETIPPETQNQFRDYASKINELVLTLNEGVLREEAFKKMGVLKIADEVSKKAAGQKIRDLCDAIEVLCNSGEEAENARFNYPIQIQLDLAFLKRIKKKRKPTKKSFWIDKKVLIPSHYDERTDVTRDFSTINTLHYEGAVTKLPAEKIERFKNLKRIDLPVYQVEEINVSEFRAKFSGISVDIKKPIIGDDPGNTCIHRDHSGHTTFVFDTKKKNELILNRRDLDTYPWETLSDTLTDLNLSSNKLTNIGSMKHLKNLQSLSLAVNQIKEIDGNLLPESLTTINFSNNLLTDATFLGSLKNLKELWIGNNQIETIPWENLPETLEDISVGQNKLKFVGSMKDLKNLSNLSLHGNEITSILWEDLPEGLERLVLSKNKINNVPSLKHLKNLELLHLEGNKIISIAWDCLPGSLKELVIYDNFITHMESMKHLSNLKWLNAHNNRLEAVEWENLPESLPSIILWNNNLTIVGSIKHLKNLYELDLHENQISSILWEDLPSTLHEINLSHNLLTSIGSIAHLKDVERLELDDNRITAIQWEFLPPNVKNLDLSKNHISTLCGSTKSLTYLERLNLEFNYLTVISADIFTFPNLDDLELNNNAITEITSIDADLDNFILPLLNLSNNNFNFEISNLIEKLWSNLPLCDKLVLNGNNLDELPCLLKGKFTNLFAVNCNLEYICPKLPTYPINLNIGNNPKLAFPFHPRMLFPSQYPKDNDDFDVDDETFIIGDFKISPNIRKFKKTVKNEEDKARYENRVYFELEVFNRDPETLHLPSQWKATVRTRVCEECQKFTTMLIEDVNLKKDDISNDENDTSKRIRIEQPSVTVTEEDSFMNVDGSVMNKIGENGETFSGFPQQSYLPPPPQHNYYHYEEPHGSSSKSIPLTNTIPIPQQRSSHEQYFYGHNDISNPPDYHRYQIPTNSAATHYDGSVIERIIVQDSFGNQLMTAPATSIIPQQNYGNLEINQFPQTTFNNLHDVNNQPGFATNALPKHEPYHYGNGMPQFVDHQQQIHNSTNIDHLQNIHNDVNVAYYSEPHFYHPENHEFQQNPLNNYYSDYHNSSEFLNDINKL